MPPEGTVGLWALPDEVRWADSGIRELRPGDTLDLLAGRFDQQKLYLQLVDWPHRSSDLRGFVDEEFFEAAPHSQALGTPKIVSLDLNGHVLDMELASPTDVLRARLLFDVKTRSLLKVVDNIGNETPRSVLQHLVDDVHQLQAPAPGYCVKLRFGDYSVSGFYRLGTGPTSQPPNQQDANVAVTLFWFDGGEQAQTAFRDMVDAQHGTLPATEPVPAYQSMAIYTWPGGRIVQCLGNRIVLIDPKVSVPSTVSEQLLQACLRRWASRGLHHQ